MTESWSEISHVDEKEAFNTGISIDKLRDIGDKITALPVGSNFHRLVKKIFEARSKSI
jgi:2-oxoglutarate dehydrogenase complex dehydrogenase (E1) component-like enzyme